MSLYAAYHNLSDHFVIGDTLEPIIELWEMIIERPQDASKQYRSTWIDNLESSLPYYNEIRARYNRHRDPIDLLYLICRCVKNAIRFNKDGNFTQSVDKRRLGMSPDKMEIAIFNASKLLKGKTTLRKGDWLNTIDDAKPYDFVYMDPPYLGTTIGRDKRYHQQLELEDLVNGLSTLNDKNIRFVLSYDGMTGEKTYGPPLPQSLNMSRVLLHAGRSSQATLQGRNSLTFESLYLSNNLGRIEEKIIYESKKLQNDLAF